MKKTAINAFCDRVIDSTTGSKFLEFLDITIGTIVLPVVAFILLIVSFFFRVEMPLLVQIYLYYKLGTLILLVITVIIVKKKQDSVIESIVVLLKEIEATTVVFFYEFFSRKKLSH